MFFVSHADDRFDEAFNSLGQACLCKAVRLIADDRDRCEERGTQLAKLRDAVTLLGAAAIQRVIHSLGCTKHCLYLQAHGTQSHAGLWSQQVLIVRL